MPFPRPVLLLYLLLGHAALAVAADPVVTTGAATQVTDLTATLNGSVTPGAGNVVYNEFQIGTDTSYPGSATARPVTSGGSGTEALTATVEFLLPNTTYHYRAVARHAYNNTTFYGADQTFTTSAPNTPPSFQVGGVLIKTTTAQLGAYSIRAGSSTATLSLEYGTSTAYGSIHNWPDQFQLNQFGSVSHVLTGLPPSTTYHYRIKAVNAQGTTYSEDQTFRTLDPPVITTGTPSQVTDLTVRVNGTINARNGGYNCVVEYGPTTNYGSSQPTQAFVGGSDTPLSVPLDDLQASTLYHYRIRVTDGVTTYSGEDATFTTGPAATPPRINMVTSWVSNNTPTQAGVAAWSGFSGSSPATISFEYGTTTAYGTTVTRPGTIPANTSWAITDPKWLTLTGLTPSTEYHFRVQISNAEGTGYSADATFTTPPGISVLTLPSSGVTDVAATLNGSANTQGEYLDLYFDYGTTTDYGQSALAAGHLQNSVAQSFSFQPPRLLPSTTYHYRLRGWNVYAQQHVFLGADQTFTTGPAATPPTATAAFAALVTNTRATLGCHGARAGSSPATVVFEYGETAAYGSTIADDDIIPTNQTGLPEVSVTGLTPGTTYHIRCVLTNAEGSFATEDVTFTTINAPEVTTGAATSVTDHSAVVNGSVKASAQVIATFELGTTTAYGTLLNATPGNFSGTGTVAVTAAAPGLLPNTTYHFRTRIAYYADPQTLYYGPDMTFTTAPPSTPPAVSTAGFINTLRPMYAHVQGSASAGSSTATLTWEYGITTAYGSTATPYPATLAAGTSNQVTGTLAPLLPSTTYHYRLRATNGQGTSYGADVSFTTPAGIVLTTGAASNVTDLSATLSGSTPGSSSGESVTLGFEYGTTTAYGNDAPGYPVHTVSNGIVTTTMNITGLLPDTTYHYRIRGSAGLVGSPPFKPTYYGQDMTFTTGPAITPPTVNSTESAPAGYGLQLTGTKVRAVITAGSSPATVLCEYGLDTTYGTQVIHPQVVDTSTTGQPLLTLSGLQPATTYHYRFVATNAQGTAQGPDATFTTLSLPTVTTTSAVLNSTTSATLQGSFNKQGAVYTVDFEYGTTTAYGSSVPMASGTGGIIIGGGGPIIIGGGTITIGGVVTGGGLIIGGGNTTTLGPGSSWGSAVYADASTRDATANITGLTPDTTYHYRIRLTDEAGNRYNGMDATFTTPATPSAAWRLRHFNSSAEGGQAADDACPAGDGISNLLKYALCLSPNTPGTLPAAQVREHEGRKYLTFTFDRDPTNPDLCYEVQTADNLQGPWTTVTQITGTGAPSGTGFVREDPNWTLVLVGLPPAPPRNTIEVRDPVSMEDAPQRYMRLKVTRLP